ncbi:hypothetical protein GOB85_10505 [Acetobacter sp. LMG 1636]|uniref:Heme NO-binding domain-containing protein n=1 Tax=Acetobacter fallax TaxID=1737473 RepID=A0ABX0KEN9_9PROT|nr:hypothetical protein [Acetobacter fallax]NHO36535.1 hypothetical protein [Acetobacter fallax]
MKGIVFNLLEDAVSEHYGAETWELLLDDTGLDGVYSSLGDYPDSNMQAIVEAAALRLKIPGSDVLRWFGEAAMPLLKNTYPEIFAPFHSSRAFILSEPESESGLIDFSQNSADMGNHQPCAG